MKKTLFIVAILLAGLQFHADAQKWSDLSDEQKMMDLKEFREDNQNYLKNTLKLSEEQLSDVDNVNVCYVSTLDRISRYGKTDAEKEKYAKTATSARSVQLDAIMGADNRKKFQAYVQEKLKKAKEKLG